MYLEIVFHILVVAALLYQLLESLRRYVRGRNSHLSLPLIFRTRRKQSRESVRCSRRCATAALGCSSSGVSGWTIGKYHPVIG